MGKEITQEEKKILLRLARQALEAGVCKKPIPILDSLELTPTLQTKGASFVTLTVDGNLRGCIGALEAYQSLAEDVREHAIAAALEDYRFPNVEEDELKSIRIEISRLTEPSLLNYSDSNDLKAKLRPGVDGVILRDGFQRATFLPQVWEKIPDPGSFLANLCVKMGAAPDLWNRKHLEVLIYQVDEFHE